MDGSQVAELAERRQSQAVLLTVAQAEIDAAENRIRLYGQCLENTMQGAVHTILCFNVALVGLHEHQVQPFDGEPPLRWIAPLAGG